MDKDDYINYCKSIKGASLDKPFKDITIIAVRHSDTKKWFALIMKHNEECFVNLKCEPFEAGILRNSYKGITPAYHMNKKHWNSVYFNSDIPDELIKKMTLTSFNLTNVKK